MLFFKLEKGGGNKQWCNDAKRRLRDSKQYLKTDYPVHCKPNGSTCTDHCRQFAPSDGCDPDFQVLCSHQHTESCDECQALKTVLDEVEHQIRGSSWNPYNQEHQDDLLYDFEEAHSDKKLWKAHILRLIHQKEAKQDALRKEGSSLALIIMDWVMKFLQLKYQERQCDWYGKRGLSWHISTVISFDASSGDRQLKSYAHLFNSCLQDWFAVCSVIENLLKIVKTENPVADSVYLRSDGTGCNHDNFLIAAVKDVGEQVGVNILRYNYSEPRHGKDVCERILCPFKAFIHRYCNEGHDIVSAEDMHTALSECQVRGISACVCSIDASKRTLDVRNIEGISSYHNFEYETRTHVYTQSADAIDTEKGSFSCPETGCQMNFKKFGDLEVHLDIGDHTVGSMKKESIYDKPLEITYSPKSKPPPRPECWTLRLQP